jgi:hypothetical protein
MVLVLVLVHGATSTHPQALLDGPGRRGEISVTK